MVAGRIGEEKVGLATVHEDLVPGRAAATRGSDAVTLAPNRPISGTADEARPRTTQEETPQSILIFTLTHGSRTRL